MPDLWRFHQEEPRRSILSSLPKLEFRFFILRAGNGAGKKKAVIELSSITA
jgi:hypothetical protein